MKTKTAETHLSIDKAAIAANFETLSSYKKGVCIMPVVKANGYSTCARHIATITVECGATHLCVAHVSEAIKLRQAGISIDIVVLSTPLDTIDEIADWRLTPVVSSRSLVDRLAATGRPISVHLNINTGLNRFGVRDSDGVDLARSIEATDSLSLDGVMTHFASSSDPAQDDTTFEQIRRFQQVCHALRTEDLLPQWVHATATAGHIRFDIPECTMARCAIGLFGVGFGHLNLQPAVRLSTHIVYIQTCKAGESVGYGATYTTERDARIAIVSFGYHDGLNRISPLQRHVIISGHKAPIIGRVCMDFAMCDVTDIPDAKAGDEAVLIGDGITLEEYAQAQGQVPQEALATLGPRIVRHFD